MKNARTLFAGIASAVVLLSPALWGQTLTYTNGLDIWLDAQDMNGNGDGNSGWTDGESLSTSAGQRWVNKGTTGVGNPVGYGVCVVGDGAGAPTFYTNVLGPDRRRISVVGFDRDNIKLPEFMNTPTYTAYAIVRRWNGGNSVGEQPILWDYGTNGPMMTYCAILTNGVVRGVLRDATNGQVIADSTVAVHQCWTEAFWMVNTNASGQFTFTVGRHGDRSSITNSIYDATTWEGTVNGAPFIGSFPSNTTAHAFQGNIAELLIYDHALSEANQAAVEAYLAAKYFSSTEGLAYWRGLSVWLDAQDMNGNGDGNAGWIGGRILSTGSGSNWINKGWAYNPSAYGYEYSGCPYNILPPVYSNAVAAPNGQIAAVAFAATNNIVFNEFMVNDTFTVVAVAKRTGSGILAEPIFWDYGDVSAKNLSLQLDDGLVVGVVRDSGNDNLGTTNTSAAIGMDWAEAVWRLRKSGTAFTIEVGPYGTLASAQNASYGRTTWNGTHLPPTIGSYPTALVHAFQGYLAELIIYDHALSDGNLDRINRYLNLKYGVGMAAVKGSLFMLR